MSEIEKYTSLIKEKEDLEDINKKLSYEIKKKCEHNIEYGYYFPYPHICFECSKNYYKYCKKKEIYIDETLFLQAIEAVEYEEKKAQEEKELKKQQAKEYREKERIRKIEENKKKKEYEKKNRLEIYKNKKNLTAEEAGKRYERYIGYLLESDGFLVEYHGILKGVKDGGIDILAKKKDNIYVIQCKRYAKSHYVHENTITQLIGTLSTYKRKFTNKKVSGILFTSSDNLDEEAKEALELHIEIQHIVKPYDYDYPMVKCNVGKNGEKIYHLPEDAMYDRIKIEINKGEFYCKTIEEAEKFGFRRSKN